MLGEVERGGRTKEPGFRVSDARTTDTLPRHLDHQCRGLAENSSSGRLAVCVAQTGGPGVWGRRIVAAEVHETECQELAAALVERVLREASLPRGQLYLHSDNGGPMKGTSCVASFSSRRQLS